MHNNWPTQKRDMQAAAHIINKYAELNDGEPLDLIEIEMDDQETMNLRAPDWVMELTDYFNRQYGEEQGSVVTSMVLTKVLLQGETIH